ncbi:hypothetical protein JR316_0005803 [Psilocybe cubensis]|uniref:Uncharacterized protein n=2 Tax=Psilocybe cubensis TaxID=181762 RepID=A0ACB8H089_PSICU|nr:hypothetical protein JR316_0005803 [Psilocybe cubensis]KAH9481281.1 hypothetical protein JR316_0005803 [Psilocybe cubensis]
MADLQSRIGPKQEEQPFFRNKTWKRPGLHTPNKTATAVWDTSDTTNEGDSDSGSGNFNDDQYFISSPPPLSFSNSASPDRPSLQDRLMDGPILPGLIHQSPETEQLKNASKPLIDRVAIHDDNAERGFHDIRDGGEMDIDQDNDDVISSGSIDKSQNLKNVGTSDPNQPRIASLTSASETRNQTSSNNAGFGSQQKRNSSQLTLAQRMQNGYAPPRPNYSNTHTSPSKFNFNNNLEMNNVMPHERSGGSNSAQEDGHQSPLSSDPIRTIMMPVVQQNADCRANNDDSKNGPPQQKTVNPKVFTNEISASFSELGRKVHKDMQDRDLPRRSPPRVDPRNGSTIASTSTQERVEAPLYSPGTAHAYNQKAYNQHVNSAPGAHLITTKRPFNGIHLILKIQETKIMNGATHLIHVTVEEDYRDRRLEPFQIKL